MVHLKYDRKNKTKQNKYKKKKKLGKFIYFLITGWVAMFMSKFLKWYSQDPAHTEEVVSCTGVSICIVKTIICSGSSL